MEIVVTRDTRSIKTTTGKLYINGEFECYTLEDVDRGLKQNMPIDEIKKRKLYGDTCIPEGRYEVIITYSPLFKKAMPLLLNVPGYEAIRIHPGNTDKDTLGCILLGSERSKDFVANSRIAFDKFYKKFEAAITKGDKVFITINK